MLAICIQDSRAEIDVEEHVLWKLQRATIITPSLSDTVIRWGACLAMNAQFASDSLVDCCDIIIALLRDYRSPGPKILPYHSVSPLDGGIVIMREVAGDLRNRLIRSA